MIESNSPGKNFARLHESEQKPHQPHRQELPACHCQATAAQFTSVVNTVCDTTDVCGVYMELRVQSFPHVACTGQPLSGIVITIPVSHNVLPVLVSGNFPFPASGPAKHWRQICAWKWYHCLQLLNSSSHHAKHHTDNPQARASNIRKKLS
jgi:hypothetical protein